MNLSRREIVDGCSRLSRVSALAGIAAIGLATAALAQPGYNSFPGAVRGYNSPAPALPAATAQEATARRILEGQVRALGQAFSGDIGIAVRDVQSGWTTSYDGDTFFPQQSVSKFWVALAALDKADRGELSLDAPVTVQRDDMTLFHQPIAAQLGGGGYSTTLNTLIYRAITQSDNTCNDFVLWKAGGPAAVRDFLRSRGIEGIRFGPGERMLQSQIAGIEWKQSYAYNGGFYKARAAVPAAQRRAAFERYIANPMDGATPNGIVDALGRLKRGELLSAASTRKLLSTMGNTKTGAQRLKGGLSAGWSLSHKTGTGQVLGGEQAGYNDIGILTGPDGRSYAVAVMIRRTSAPLGHRMAAMQNIVRAVISFDQNMTSYGMARYGVGSEQGSR
ncbi:MAG TPA: class A beta-lactamase [Allosphingosinicella sp.]|nr:class A beta-lactamase [Allosphingosinicella sp.]